MIQYNKAYCDCLPRHQHDTVQQSLLPLLAETPSGDQHNTVQQSLLPLLAETPSGDQHDTVQQTLSFFSTKPLSLTIHLKFLVKTLQI